MAQNTETRRHGHRFLICLGIVLLVIALLLGGFVLFLTVTEYRPADVEPAQFSILSDPTVFDGSPFRIVSFNTGYASLGKDSDFVLDGGKTSGTQDRPTVEANMAGIGKIFQDADADFYMVQEIDQDSSRTYGINQLDAYAKVLPDHSWYYAPNYVCKFVPFPVTDPMGSIHSGVATYSRYQVSDAQRISLPVPFSWPVRTANLKRCMLETRIPIAGSDAELVILNFHLEAYDSGEGKTAQTQQVLQILQEEYEKGNYVIAGGDFNQIFPEVETFVKPTSQWVPGNLDPLPDSFEGWRYVYDDSVPTCRLLNQPYDPEDSLTQFYVIDGFIVSPNLEVTQIQTLDQQFEFSDHNPVVMDVTLKEGQN